MLKLSCPRCKSNLVRQDYYSAVIDRCSGCRGIWIDHRRLKEIIRLKYHHLSPEDAERAAASRERARASEETGDPLIHCPMCGEQMERFNYPGTKIMLDRCAGHGNWLDEGELERIEVAAEKIGPPLKALPVRSGPPPDDPTQGLKRLQSKPLVDLSWVPGCLIVMALLGGLGAFGWYVASLEDDSSSSASPRPASRNAITADPKWKDEWADGTTGPYPKLLDESPAGTKAIYLSKLLFRQFSEVVSPAHLPELDGLTAVALVLKGEDLSEGFVEIMQGMFNPSSVESAFMILGFVRDKVKGVNLLRKTVEGIPLAVVVERSRTIYGTLDAVLEALRVREKAAPSFGSKMTGNVWNAVNESSRSPMLFIRLRNEAKGILRPAWVASGGPNPKYPRDMDTSGIVICADSEEATLLRVRLQKLADGPYKQKGAWLRYQGRESPQWITSHNFRQGEQECWLRLSGAIHLIQCIELRIPSFR